MSEPSNGQPTNGELSRQIIALTAEVRNGFESISTTVEANTAFRIGIQAQIRLIRWGAGLLGVSNLVIIFRLFI